MALLGKQAIINKATIAQLLLLLFLCFTSVLQAQEHNSKFTFGIKAGFNRSITTGKELDGERTGYIGTEVYGSVFGQYAISNSISGQIEALFSWTDNVNYIEIPVYLMVDIYKRWSVKSGAKFDYIPDSELSLTTGGVAIVSRTGFSIPMGVEFSISKKWLAEVVYNIGLTQQANDLVLEIFKATRNTLRVGLGYRF
ncbi:MAG: outer membrane beta-barrel protein [Dokdonia sp.]